jgi:pimeloyl-ACP methyl ester carboxylesterase
VRGDDFGKGGVAGVAGRAFRPFATDRLRAMMRFARNKGADMADRVRFEERWIDVGGVRTRYLIEGEGEPLLLIHGGHFGDSNSAECAEVWNRNIPDLARHFTCVAVDRIGQGFTDNPLRDEDFTMAASVRHVADFVRVVGLAPCHVVGHSRGGYVAARLTADHPELVASCTIATSNSVAPGAATNEIVFGANPHPLFSRERALYVMEHYSYAMDHVTPDWFQIRIDVLQSEKYRAGAKRMADAALYVTQFSPQLEDDRRALLDHIARVGLRRPTLVMWSRNDATAPVSQGLKLFELLSRNEPRTELHLLDRTGHYCYREQAQGFNRTLIDFLMRHSSTGRDAA